MILDSPKRIGAILMPARYYGCRVKNLRGHRIEVGIEIFADDPMSLPVELGNLGGEF
jgi:hypothetical protein